MESGVKDGTRLTKKLAQPGYWESAKIIYIRFQNVLKHFMMNMIFMIKDTEVLHNEYNVY